MTAAAEHRRSEELHVFARSAEQAVRDELALLSTELREKRGSEQRMQAMIEEMRASMDAQQRSHMQRFDELKKQVCSRFETPLSVKGLESCRRQGL